MKKIQVQITPILSYCFPMALLGVCLAWISCSPDSSADRSAADWIEKFNLESCTFSSTGRNDYFILEPGYQLILEEVDEDTTRLVITVLNATVKVGEVETRIVEEKESINGNLVEISRNFFAFCTQTKSVFYFGEEVDIYKQGKVASHEGEWRADSNDARAGLMIPGVISPGYRYYQEIAPGVAMDRAEIKSNTATYETPAGTFENCLITEETTPLEPRSREDKIYAPGVGLIKDGELSLIEHGFVN
ncbi:MAG: hypothetical protein L0Y74_09585 [candidate division Zixibacteria bacterium]|nr:hypothetical protein [candidate division Zixibacteria bacterium]